MEGSHHHHDLHHFLESRMNESRKEYINRHHREHYTQLKVSVSKSQGEQFKVACKKLGKSQASVFKAAIDDVIKKASQTD